MPTLWFDTLVGINVTSGTNGSQLLGGDLSELQRRTERLTLLRTIIRLDIAAIVRDSGEGDNILAIGVGVASQEAAAAGVFSDPDVSTDYPTTGWVWRSRYRIYAVSTNDQNIDLVRVDLDLRGKRLIKNGRLFLNATNTVNQGVDTGIAVLGLIRTLYLVG